MRVLRDAMILMLLAAGLGLGANAVRPSGRLALVAREPYEVLRPCPEAQGRAEALLPEQLRAGEPGMVALDARAAEEFRTWHFPGARSLPFDYLTPVSADTVAELLKLRPRRVVVYGDGQNPDSGEQLSREIASRGLKNVFFVRGGAPALRVAASRAKGAKP